MPLVRAEARRPGEKAAADTGTSTQKPVGDVKEAKGTTSTPSTPGSGDNSVFPCIAPDGTVREVFREKALVLSLLLQGGHLLVGTGMDGQLFEVDPATREKTELARLDHGQILCLCPRRDGSIVLGTGDPGKVFYVLGNLGTMPRRGSPVASEVLDAGNGSASGAAWSGRPTPRPEPPSVWPCAAATWPSPTTPGATGRRSRPTRTRLSVPRPRPASCSTA